MRIALLAALSALTVHAAPYAAYCTEPATSPPTCFAVNVPDNSADELYMTIHGAANTGYTGWAVGDGVMANSLFFIARPSPSNGTASVQVAYAAGHVRPSTYTATNITTTVLSSNFTGDAFTVSFRCTNCRSWRDSSGGVRSVSTSSSQGIIWAYGSVDSGNIAYHGGSHGSASLNLASAVGTAGAPQLASTASGASTGTSGSTGTNGTQTAATSRSMSGLMGITATRYGRLWLAHAIITPTALIGIGGLGALVVRFLPVAQKRGSTVSTSPVRIHWIIQSIAAALFLAGAILGFVASGESYSGHFTYAHQILGTVVYVLVFVQAFAGSLNHALYNRSVQASEKGSHSNGSSPARSVDRSGTAVTRTGAFIHRWAGRAILILAIVAVGLALRQPMVNVSTAGQIAWYVVVLIVFVGGYTVAALVFRK